jgi:hypothetical protein
MIPGFPYIAYYGWRGRQPQPAAAVGVLANSLNVEVRFYL